MPPPNAAQVSQTGRRFVLALRGRAAAMVCRTPLADGVFQLEALFTGQSITFITGSKFQIDSPYDRHWLRFKTQEPLLDERAVITITKKESGQEAAVQFDMPILVAGRRLKAILIGIVLGLFLALPQVITAWVNPAFQSNGLPWLLGLAGFIALLNIAVGIAAALNFRKPL